jgi:hypothetical protein
MLKREGAGFRFVLVLLRTGIEPLMDHRYDTVFVKRLDALTRSFCVLKQKTCCMKKVFKSFQFTLHTYSEKVV